jgi:hypothetical protein
MTPVAQVEVKVDECALQASREGVVGRKRLRRLADVNFEHHCDDPEDGLVIRYVRGG